MGHKPRPARSLDPCREPDLFTPFQRAGCVSGTAPASPSWRRRQRQHLGAEHRKPRLPPRSARRRGWRGERGGCEGGKRVAAAHFHSKRTKSTPSHQLLHPPPHIHSSWENVWGRLQHEFGPTGIGSGVQWGAAEPRLGGEAEETPTHSRLQVKQLQPGTCCGTAAPRQGAPPAPGNTSLGAPHVRGKELLWG